MNKSIRTAAALAATLLWSAGASAEGGYFGVGLGKASIDETVSEGGLSGAIDENSTAWKVFGGFFITDNLGVELGWTDLGDMNEGGNVDIETEGFMAAAIGSLPIGDGGFSVHAKLGAYAWDQDIAITPNGAASNDGVDAVYGIGAKYVYDEMFGIQLDWERYNAKADVDLISIGLTLNF
ncbi:outer membrane beta-barrel protein [Thiohalobacter sp. IOR34]|uniref:outer membrane beta-barrel protein n=1 Tax=Thiohalobacter sp. IOR34 TaxID=3057176 RepID=UPI0025B156EF|nr:outer membrane beta-barrel protein [Thiohalobacter sp. IOR34]WJW75517.1 outer membrane beta-barrel protein [Thiohalobacter sp. IOR34]